MTKDLDEALETMRAALARADSVRADASAKSGTKAFVSSTEIDLGPQGGGEVEFYVAVRYSIDVQATLKSIKNVDWVAPDEDGKDVPVPARKAPYTAIETAIKRYVDKNQKRYVEELLSSL